MVPGAGPFLAPPPLHLLVVHRGRPGIHSPRGWGSATTLAPQAVPFVCAWYAGLAMSPFASFVSLAFVWSCAVLSPTIIRQPRTFALALVFTYCF